MKKTGLVGQTPMNVFWHWFLVVVFVAATGVCVWHIHMLSNEFASAFKILEDKGFYEGKRPFIDTYGRFALSLLVAVIALVVRLSVTRDGLGTPARWVMIGFMPLTLLTGWVALFVTADFHSLQNASDGLLDYDGDSMAAVILLAPLNLIAAIPAWLFSFGAYSAGANLQNTDLTRNHILLYFYWMVITIPTGLCIWAALTASSSADRYVAISQTAVLLLWFYYASAIGIGRTNRLAGKQSAELARYYKFGAGEE